MDVLDMSPFIAPKSNQLTADDLLSGDRVITITNVELSPGAEQPCRVSFEGDGGKPWFPCKSMGRVLVKAWGPDAKKYAGKSLKLFRDPDVTWAGMKIGGIRIKELSDISAPFDMALTATRGKKAMARFLPLKIEQTDEAAKWANGFKNAVAAVDDEAALDALIEGKTKALSSLEQKRPELHAECQHAIGVKRDSFSVGDAPETSEGAFEDDGFSD